MVLAGAIIGLSVFFTAFISPTNGVLIICQKRQYEDIIILLHNACVVVKNSVKLLI